MSARATGSSPGSRASGTLLSQTSLRLPMNRRSLWLLLLAACAQPSAPRPPANVTAQMFPATPLTDMGSSLYLGQYDGGLFGQGSNVPPPGYDSAERAQGRLLQRLDVNGNPSPT